MSVGKPVGLRLTVGRSAVVGRVRRPGSGTQFEASHRPFGETLGALVRHYPAMNTRGAALFVTALATSGCLLLSGCTGSSDEPDSPSESTTAAAPESAAPSASGATTSPGAGVIASANPTTVPAPETDDDVVGVEVELSSSTSAAGEPVQVTVTVPEELAEEAVVLVSPADDDVYDVITAPVQVNADRQAFMTLDMGKTMSFRAIVPKDDLSDASTIPEDAPILGESEDFTITVE